MISARFKVFRLLLSAAMLVSGASAVAQVGPLAEDRLARTPPALVSTDRPRDDFGSLRNTEYEGSNASLPLGVGADSSQSLLIPDADAPRQSPAGGTARTMLALAGVLALIFGLSWIYKKAARSTGGIANALGAGGRAPAGVVEVLARYPIASRQTLVVLRFDRRVLLCSMASGGRSSAGAMTTLCELDDAEDVASVLVKTRDDAGESIARSFERALDDADLSVERAAGNRPIQIRTPNNQAERATVTRTGGLGPSDDNRGALARGLESIWRGGNK